MDEVPENLDLSPADVDNPQALVSDGALILKSRVFSDVCRKNGVLSALRSPREWQDRETLEYCRWNGPMHDGDSRSAPSSFASTLWHQPSTPRTGISTLHTT